MAFEDCFQQLRGILAAHADGLVVTQDGPGNYSLDAPGSFPGQKVPAFFGAAQIRKRYVSYHLMPVYARPDLLEGLSPALEKRKQGKSCFNFSAPLDAATLAELRELTARGIAAYRAVGLVA